MTTDECQNITGYHGTNAELVESIRKNNFDASKGESHWLGEGVYFFVEGVSVSPAIDARGWGIASAWNKVKKQHDYTHYAVLSAKIRLYKLWDLTVQEGLKVFNYARQGLLEKLKKGGEPDRRNFDTAVIGVVKERMKFQVIKANFYIRFKSERIQKIESRIPNVTVLAVSNPTDNIDMESIRVESKGKIKP